MIGRLLYLIVFLLILSSSLQAEEPFKPAHVDVRASREVILKPGENCTNTPWLKPNPEAWVRCLTLPLTSEWQSVNFTFTPDQTCDVSLVLEGSKSGAVLYRNVRAITGTTIPNGTFNHATEKSCAFWQGDYRIPTPPLGGVLLVDQREKQYAVNRIKVEAGKTVSLQFEIRAVPETELASLNRNISSDCSAFIDARGHRQLILEPKTNCENTRWLKPNPKAWVRCKCPVTTEWQSVSFSFTPTQTGDISLVLGGTGSGVIIYRNLRVNGANIRNGEFKYTTVRSAAFWKGNFQNPVPGKDGLLAIDPSKKQYAVTRATLKAGEVVTVTIDFRAATSEELQFIQESEPKKSSDANSVEFRTGNWFFSFDRESGSWLKLSHGGKVLFQAGTELEPPFDLKLEHGFLGHECKISLERFVLDEKEKSIDLFYRAGEWRFQDRLSFNFSRGAERLRRSFALTSVASEPRKFQGVLFSYRLPGDGDYFAPGSFLYSQEGIWSAAQQLAAESERNRKGRFSDRKIPLRLAHYLPLLLLRADRGKTLLFFANKYNEGGQISLNSTHLNWNSSASGWAEPNRSQQLDDCYFEVSDLDPEIALRECAHSLMRAAGAVRPERPADWLYDCRLYGLWFPRMRMADFSMLAQGGLERILEMGFNAIYFPPLNEGAVRYAPIDFFSPEPVHGNWEDFRRLTHSLKQRGIRSLLDIVPHGWDIPTLRERPVTPDGLFLRGRSADFNSPDWNEYLKQVAAFYGTLGVDGFRIDAPAGSMISNWRRPGFPAEPLGYCNSWEIWNRNRKPVGKIPQKEWRELIGETGTVPALAYARASQAGLLGGLNISRSIRTGIREKKSDAATILETHGFPFSLAGDSTYDILFRNLPYKYIALQPEEFVKRLAQWLDEAPFTDLEGALLMRNLVMNDDRVSLMAAGPGLTRVFFALMYFIPGFPLGYSDCDFGHAEYLKHLNALRASHPVLSRGTAKYTTDGAVLAIQRKLGRDEALIRLNFSPEFCSGIPPFGMTLMLNGRRLTAVPHAQTELPVSRKLTLDDNTVKAANYTLDFNPKTGLPQQIDLLSRPDCPIRLNSFSIQKTGDIIWTESRFSSGVVLRFECRPESIRLYTEGEGYALLWDATDMHDWQIAESSILLEDWVSPAYAASPLLKPSYARNTQLYRPEVDGLLFDSRQYPLSPGRKEIRLFPKKTGAGMAFRFFGDSSPAIELFRQFAGVPGLQLLWAPENGSRVLEYRPCGIRLAQSDISHRTKFGEVSLLTGSAVWEVENNFYRVRLSRSGGALLSLFDKNQKKELLGISELTLTPENGKPLRMYFDPESNCRISGGTKELTLSFEGELRPSFRSCASTPLRYSIEYRFTEAAGFTFLASAWSPVTAYPRGKLEYKVTYPEGTAPKNSGLFLAGNPVSVMPLCRYQFSGGWNTLPPVIEASCAFSPKSLTLSAISQLYSVHRNGLLHQPHRWLPPESFFVTDWRVFPGDGAVFEMQFCDGVFRQSLPMATLEPGRYRLTLRYGGEKLAGEPANYRQKGHLRENYQPQNPGSMPIEISVNDTLPDGMSRTFKDSFFLSGDIVSAEHCFEFDVKEVGTAPWIRIFSKPGRRSRFFIQNIQCEKLL